MYTVYILKSITKPTKTYVGQTIKDIKDRLSEHNAGLSKFTKTFKPWKLIYFEQFYCQTCTNKRESFLKSGVGFRFRKMIAEHYSELDSAMQNGE